MHLYRAVTPCYCSLLGALGRVVSFEACCQWALLRAQITTLLFELMYRSTYMYPSASKVHAGSVRVSVIHRTLKYWDVVRIGSKLPALRRFELVSKHADHSKYLFVCLFHCLTSS